METHPVSAENNSGDMEQDHINFNWTLFFREYDGICDVLALRRLLHSSNSVYKARRLLVAALLALPDTDGDIARKFKGKRLDVALELEKGSPDFMHGLESGALTTSGLITPEDIALGSSQIKDPCDREGFTENEKIAWKKKLFDVYHQLIDLFRHGLTQNLGVDRHPDSVTDQSRYLLTDFHRQWGNQRRYWWTLGSDEVIGKDNQTYTLIRKFFVDEHADQWNCWIVTPPDDQDVGFVYYNCQSNPSAVLSMVPDVGSSDEDEDESSRKKKKKNGKRVVYGPHR